MTRPLLGLALAAFHAAAGLYGLWAIRRGDVRRLVWRVRYARQGRRPVRCRRCGSPRLGGACKCGSDGDELAFLPGDRGYPSPDPAHAVDPFAVRATAYLVASCGPGAWGAWCWGQGRSSNVAWALDCACMAGICVLAFWQRKNARGA